MWNSSTLQNDIRYALRMMRRTPLFAAAVVLTVAIAIAANSTIFTVVNAVMIRSLPFGEPKRILQVAEKNDKLHLPSRSIVGNRAGRLRDSRRPRVARRSHSGAAVRVRRFAS